MLILVYIGLLHRQLCQWSQNQPHQESDIPPLDANELYDTLQSREEEEEEEEEEEQEYIEMTSLKPDVQMNWKSAYRTLEV